MKKKLMIPFCAMIFAMTLSVNVHAISYTLLSSNNKEGITTVDDLLQEEGFQNEVKEYLTEKYGENYKEKLKRNEQAVKNAEKIEAYFPKTRNGDIIYPDYIGGLYIDDNDNLVIQVVESSIPTKNDIEYSSYQSVLAVDKGSKTEYVKYSYEELQEVHDQILDYFLGDENDMISGLYIDVISNRVVVELTNFTENEIKEFKNSVTDSSMVSFKNGRNFESISTVNPGAFFQSSTSQGCSYGYRARNSAGQEGVVTAAHCFLDKGNGSISSVGPVKNWQCSGKIDAAFVQNTNGATLTNTLAQKIPMANITTLSTNIISSFYRGQVVTKVGFKTGVTSGPVSAPSYSLDINGVKFTDLVEAGMTGENGDSGGIVMNQDALLTGQTYLTAGICTARYGTTSTAFTKASNINSTFGLSRY